MFVLRAFTVALAALLLSACSKGGGKGPPSQVRQVKGNPYVFVANATMNFDNSIPVSIFDSSNEWMLRPRGFAEEPPEQPKGDIEDGNEAPGFAYTLFADPAEVDDDLRALSGRFRQTGNEAIFRNQFFTVRFTRDNKQGTVHLDSLTLNSNRREYVVGRDIRVLHSSFNESGFSLLVHSDTPGDRFVYDVLFTLPGPLPEFKSTRERFNYLLGQGLKISWGQEKERIVTICGEPGSGSARAVKNGVDTWSRALTGRLDLRYDSPLRCPPFSDLNNHSVTYVDEWIEVVGADQMVSAFTAAGFDFQKGEIIDSDIFFLREEIQEAINKYRPGQKVNRPGFDEIPEILAIYQQTMTHELGHFLGLHHMFEDNVPSIMGYDDVDTLQRYDYDAIWALYPLIGQGSGLEAKP